MNFAKKLRDLRTERNLTQEELAEKSGVSLKSISRYEVGTTKPRSKKFYIKLAEALNTTYDYLVSDEDNFIMDVRENFGSKGAKDANELVDGVIGLMAGGEIPDGDKKVILDAIQEAYYHAKKENEKYTPKKYLKE
ncbi:MAG: helix-turn-helix domain-containing protein [Peptoniphilaceae bacterium]